jgi:hypothetical protein
MTEPSGLEPSLSGIDFTLAIARWRLGILDLHVAEALALEALIAGYDGPALRELAGEHESWRDTNDVFERAVAELGMQVPSEEEALVTLIRAIACDVLNGSVPLLEGARDIETIYEALSVYPDAGTAVGAAYGYPEFVADAGMIGSLLWELRDMPGEREGLEGGMRQLMHKLSGAPQQPEGLAPALGGTRAEAPSEPEESPPDDRWRFEFHFNFDVNLRRFFSWSWNNRRREDP